MRKLIGGFQGVPNGEIYPVTYEAGEVCPPELEEAAAELGVLGAEEPKARKAAAENKAMQPGENK